MYLVFKKKIFVKIKNLLNPSTDKIYSKDNIEIVYNSSGSNEPILLFIHCWCGNRGFWDRQIEYFCNKYKCIALDLAGHGESGNNRNNWTIDSFANDIVKLIDKLNANQIILVAHSIGGIIALEIASKRKEKIIGIITIDSFNNIEPNISEEEIDEFLKPYERDFESTVTEYSAPYFTPQTDNRIVKQIIDKLISTDKRIAISVLKQYLLYDKSVSLQMLSHPLMCLNSDRLLANTSKLKSSNKRIEVVTLPNTGHFMMIDNYEKFNLDLEKAIKKIELGS
jgi:pimeloyl-ACP methyl ester carboxylesterase